MKSEKLILKEHYDVMSTTDYDAFKSVVGNREVESVEKIVESIKENGFLLCPILINEKNEVIDGQHRLEACRILGIPVYYVMQEGLTTEHCRKLNQFQKNWKLRDYIKSYADQGNESFGYLGDLLCQFPQFKDKIVEIATGAFGITAGGVNERLKNGNVVISKEQYEKARAKLIWLGNFLPGMKYINGKTEYMLIVLLFTYDLEEVDNDRMLRNFQNYSAKICGNGIIDTEDATKKVDEIYNMKQSKIRHVDIVHEYRVASANSFKNKKEKKE